MAELWHPWVGKDYARARVLLLGESAYSWEDNEEEDGVGHPGPDHCTTMVNCIVDRFDEAWGRKARFLKKVSQALCAEEFPDREARALAWNKVAYTNYILSSVGLGTESMRPSSAQWREAKERFRDMLNSLSPKPLHVVVLGHLVWRRTPQTDWNEELGAYEFPDGYSVALHRCPHPTSRTPGASWKALCEMVQPLLR